LATVTSATGSGSTLTVDDASYFQDGWGFPAGTGLGQISADWLRVGSSTTGQISSINYSTNTITLASSISWNNGDPVYLSKKSDGIAVLNGSTPDVGAFPSCATQQDSHSGTTTGSISVGQYSSIPYLAMPFTAGSSYTLCGVTLRMAKVGNPANMNVFIYSDNSGVPGAVVGTGSLSFASSGLSTSEGDANFIGLRAPLTNGTQYWIVAALPVDASNYVNWYFTSGGASNSFWSSLNGSAPWTNQDTYDAGKFTAISQ
jgi:hypothetical protein